MVANPSKFQVMFMGLGNDCQLCMEIDEIVMTTVDKVKPLGFVIDSKLKFDGHVKYLCFKANRNINANCFIVLLLCQISGILPSFRSSVEKPLIERLAGFISEHFASY